eukprot:Polyplicarium_translucidae@DN2245_c1_g1_i1.p1
MNSKTQKHQRRKRKRERTSKMIFPAGKRSSCDFWLEIRLFWNIFPDPQHVLNFVKTGGCEADFKLGNISKGRCYSSGCALSGGAICDHRERKVAAVSLPTMMSRLGWIKLIIDAHGKLNPKECQFKVGKLVVWTEHMTEEEVMQKRIEKAQEDAFEEFKHLGEEVAKQVADYEAMKERE